MTLPDLTAHTPAGPVRGRVSGGIVDYRGVRYGDRVDPGDRFAELGDPRAPQSEPAAFPQLPGALDALLGGALGELPRDEEAFTVRIQAPLGAAGDLPVLVFIPGGGFMTGSGEVRWFTGSPLVTEGPLVLVTVNYRIGALGHLGPEGSQDEANRGLRDLVRALKWIGANIASFGGDPGRVTLAGDSAGAWYVHALSGVPEVAGLFHRLALISLPYEPPLDREEYAARRDFVLAHLGASGAELGGMEMPRVLEAQIALSRATAGRGLPLMPADPIPGVAGRAEGLPDHPILLLTAAEEAAAFLRPVPEREFTAAAVSGYLHARFADPARVRAQLAERRPEGTPKQRMIDAMTLWQFETFALERAAERRRAGAWLGRLSLQSPMPGGGAPHCFPLPFIFGNPEQWSDAPMLGGLDPERFAGVSAVLREWLLGFVVAGVPHLAGVPLPPVDPERIEVLDVGERGVELSAPGALGVRACRPGEPRLPR